MTTQLPAKEIVPPLIALGFTPEEIREQYRLRLTETLEEEQRRLDNKMWGYEKDRLGFRMTQNGIENVFNSIISGHLSECNFQLLFLWNYLKGQQ